MNHRFAAIVWPVACLLGLWAIGRPTSAAENEANAFHFSARIPAEQRTALFVSNRAPLTVSPLVKLPIGSIVPHGWLRHQLELEADGMTGRLQEISPWCRFDGSAWSNPNGVGQNGWEEMPYWLKGYGDLGYVLNDEAIIARGQALDRRRSSPARRPTAGSDPRSCAPALDGKPDLWPHMLDAQRAAILLRAFAAIRACCRS